MTPASVRRAAKSALLGLLRLRADQRWRSRGRSRPHALPAPLYVTLTSYPKRFDVLAPTLKTLLTQSAKPDGVLLWIAEEDMGALPPEVRALEGGGLSILPTRDLRSYKKIVPALQAHPDAFLVTADDDVYYRADWLETLCSAHRPGERTVLAHRAHRMRVEGGRILPYGQWDFEIADTTPGWDVFFTGVGGVFYPPGSLPAETTDVETLMALCPAGDDIWLNWMVRRNAGLVRKVGPVRRFHEWPGSQEVALQNVNREADGNDRQIARIVERFGLVGPAAAPIRN